MTSGTAKMCRPKGGMHATMGHRVGRVEAEILLALDERAPREPADRACP
jgi:hypothetical protein